MPNIYYLRCRRCQELLKSQDQPYCSPCNLYLMYRAMPLLLGMLMTGVIRTEPVPVRSQVPLYDDGLSGYDRTDAAYWE